MYALTRHTTLEKGTKLESCTHIAQQNQKTSRTEADLCTAFCVYSHTPSTSMSTSRTELQCLQKRQIWKYAMIVSTTESSRSGPNSSALIQNEIFNPFHTSIHIYSCQDYDLISLPFYISQFQDTFGFLERILLNIYIINKPEKNVRLNFYFRDSQQKAYKYAFFNIQTGA